MKFSAEDFRPKVKLDGDSILIETDKDNYIYDVYIDRCDNPVKIVWWIHHLAQKPWMSKEKINEFIEIAMGNIGIKPYQGEG